MLAAVFSRLMDCCPGEQVKPASQVNKLTAYATDRFAIIFVKVGNRPEVRHQPGSQPHQPDIALCCRFKASC
jgi:hypothetical protein